MAKLMLVTGLSWGPLSQSNSIPALINYHCLHQASVSAMDADDAAPADATPDDASMPAKRPYPDVEGDSSPQAKRPRREDEIACSSSPLSQVSLVWILWKGMTVSFC